MSETMDVAKVVKQVNDHLVSMEFVPRDADGSDFQYGDDRSLRFKTGTSRGEVAIQIWVHDQPARVKRILHEDQIVEVFHNIDAVIDAHRNGPKSSTPLDVLRERHDEYWANVDGDSPIGVEPREEGTSLPVLKDRPGSAASY